MAPHEVLGVRPGASRDEVARAYRRFALRHHPDRGGDPARFQEGVDAYHALTGSKPPATPSGRAPANVMFHRRPRPGVRSVLRLARRRLRAARFRT